jgi:hypothetical protein
MKRLLTLLFSIFIFQISIAQLPTGSVAPNFTAKDIFGRTWDLYEILETGRPVIMDISATWCGPCWSYHSSGALEGYYADHGPEGDGKSMVLFVEGDGSTNLACLYDEPSCNGGTMGNWVDGTPYPILDNAAIFNLYDGSYFPTLYKICPDKKLELLNQINSAALWSKASACVGNVPANFGKLKSLDPGTRSAEICNPQTVTPFVTVGNLGTAVINSVTVELRWNDQLVQTKTFQAFTGVFETEGFYFDPMEVSGVGTMKAEVVSVNGSSNFQPSVLSADIIVAPEKFSSQKILLNLRTDADGKDIYWVAYDDAGNEIAHGGNELVGAEGGGQFPTGAPTHPSAYPNNTLIRDTLDVPANGCFTFKVVDAFGNGIKPPGLYRLYDLGVSTPFFTKIGESGPVSSHTFAPKTSGVNDISEILALEIFPVPATDFLQVRYHLDNDAEAAIWITNVAGQLVRQVQGLGNGEQQIEIGLKGMQQGVYFLHVQTPRGIKTQRFILSR